MPDTETPPEMSREEELGAIFEQANAEEAAPESTEASESAPEEQARDEQGRFKAQEQDSVAGDAPVEEQPEQEAEPEPETVLDAPASWSATAKAGWSGLTRELQDEILKREGDWQKADGERAQRLKGYEPIDAALAPVLQHLKLSGLEPGNYLSQLVTADQMLKSPETRAQAMQWIAQQYGIDLPKQAEPNVDPALAPFVQEINALKGQMTTFVTAQQQQESARVSAEIDAFSKDRPHFEEVRRQMGALIQSGTAPDMATAYDMAVWANPVTRAKIQAEQSAEAEAKRKAEAEEKAAKARRISQTNLSTQGTAPGSTPPQYKNREEELGAIYEQVTGA